MKHRYLTLIVLLFITVTPVMSQKSLIFDNDNIIFNRAMDLFRNEMYNAAQKQFQLAIENSEHSDIILRSESQFFSALCAFELQHEEAEYLLLQFIAENPSSIRLNKARFYLGRLYYREQNYSDAAKWLNEIRSYHLADEFHGEYYFMSGYSHFMLENFDEASRFFAVIRNSNDPYSSPANYYFSHIAYNNENYETALQGFLALRDDSSFGSLVPYYIVQIYFMQRMYDEVISLGPELIKTASQRRVPEIARLIGESYYRRRQYAEAIRYQEIFINNSESVTREDRYKLGYSYYNQNKIDDAVRLFEQVGGSNDQLSQNTNYHLADCYLKLGDKQKALMAFTAVARDDFDKTIQEDALFNASLLTFEIAYSPFNEAINGFNRFIELFPNSHRIDEAYNYLVLAYMNTRNYREALASIEKISVQNNDIRRAYQRVAYFRGLELYSNLRFEDALTVFDRSLQNSQFNPTIAAQSYYWKAESLYRLSRYNEAIQNYNRFLISPGSFELDEYRISHYNLGYAHFSNHDYSNAISWFRRYVNLTENSPTRLLGDALNRLGDSYFILADYRNAVDYYDRSAIYGLANRDYALFQKSIALGLLNRVSDKISVLNTLLADHPTSSYITEALFLMGNAHMLAGMPLQAIDFYKRLVDDFPSSSFVSSALLQLGLIDYNRNMNEQAITYYKRVTEGYPGTSESRSALAGLRNIYLDMNDVDSYVSYTRTLGDFATVTISEQDSLMYISAENLYLSENYRQAADNFKKYIEQFRSGSFRLNAHYYLADCLNRMGEYEEALASYNFVIGMFRNTFTEQSLLGASEINFRLGRYQDALKNYQELERVAEFSANVVTAVKGQMRASRLLENHESTLESSLKLLTLNDIPVEVRREAKFNVGKSYLALSRREEALVVFKEVAVEVTSREGAESKYRIAEIYYSQEKFQTAEEEIYSFVSMNTSHQYWLAKSFILLSDIYLHFGDVFQARHTLQSILDNYDNPDDGVLSDARNRMRDIERIEQQR